jgi:hypothetical protein
VAHLEGRGGGAAGLMVGPGLIAAKGGTNEHSETSGSGGQGGRKKRSGEVPTGMSLWKAGGSVVRNESPPQIGRLEAASQLAQAHRPAQPSLLHSPLSFCPASLLNTMCLTLCTSKRGLSPGDSVRQQCAKLLRRRQHCRQHLSSSTSAAAATGVLLDQAIASQRQRH